jgi:hypothetical protein
MRNCQTGDCILAPNASPDMHFLTAFDEPEHACCSVSRRYFLGLGINISAADRRCRLPSSLSDIWHGPPLSWSRITRGRSGASRFSLTTTPLFRPRRKGETDTAATSPRKASLASAQRRLHWQSNNGPRLFPACLPALPI